MSRTNIRNVAGLVKTTGAIATATLIAGCGVVSGIMNGVSNPITPDQSKAQVIDAAKDLVRAIDLPVETAIFWHSSCGDEGSGPFMGRMRIAYPLAPSSEAARAEVAGWIQRLQANGWKTDSNFHTHASAISKNGVVATFAPQSVADTTRGLELLGECRDVTTTKKTAGGNEHIDLR